MRTAEGEGIDVQQRAAFGSALVTGHFVLQPAASATAKARICLGRTLLAGGRARDALRELQRQPPTLIYTMPSRPSADRQ